MFGIGTTELVLVLAVILIVFGVGKLPEIGSGMGKAIKNFKKATAEPETALTGEERHKLEVMADKTQKREV
ncbi:MAG: twin-arginine translocase TatA/TatE family subunit [Deltaproteobacteria bacterium]|nr:twin-arginine translocase TatA/TatE family subunit [Deltaproteobacteria bacterium]